MTKCLICKKELKEDEMCSLCKLRNKQITQPMAYTRPDGTIMLKLPSDEHSNGFNIQPTPTIEQEKQIIKPKIIKRDGRKIGHLIWME